MAVRFAPQAQGQRQATLQIASNDPASPASVPLAGTGGQLPQGPPGVNGTNGKNGEIELVTCTTVTSTVIKRVGHKRIKELVRRQKCTARLVSGTVRFTTTLDQARLSRGRVVYATGSSVGTAAGRTQLLLQALRRLHPGLYTLTLRSRRGRSWTTRRLQVAVT